MNSATETGFPKVSTPRSGFFTKKSISIASIVLLVIIGSVGIAAHYMTPKIPSFSLASVKGKVVKISAESPNFFTTQLDSIHVDVLHEHSHLVSMTKKALIMPRRSTTLFEFPIPEGTMTVDQHTNGICKKHGSISIRVDLVIQGNSSLHLNHSFSRTVKCADLGITTD